MDNRFSEVELLTVAEVAAVLRVSKMTVYRKVHSGELPAVYVGQIIRIHATAVETYVSGRTATIQEGEHGA